MRQKNIIAVFWLLTACFTLSAQTATTLPKLRITASGGVGHLFSEGSSEINGIVNHERVNEMTSGLRWATHLNGDIHYLFPIGLGMGVKYLFQQTSATVDGVTIDMDDGIHYLVSDISEKNLVNFVGPSLLGYTAFGNTGRFFLSSAVSAGYAWLRSEGSILRQNLLVTSGNFAMNADVGVDYLLHSSFGVGLNVGYMLATFSKIKITDGTNSQEQTLNRDARYNAGNLYLSVGIRYLLNH